MMISIRFYLACAALFATACHQDDVPINQPAQAQAEGYNLTPPSPREAAVATLIEDIRGVHYMRGTAAPELRNHQPLTMPGKQEMTFRHFKDFSALLADIKRRQDSLRATGPLDLRDTTYNKSEEAHLRENARRLQETAPSNPK